MSPVPPPDRLALSRERLRQAMHGPAAAASAESGSPANEPAPRWLADLKSIPAVAIVIDALTHWWARHPLHVVAVVAADTAAAVVRPMAQRHPWRLVLGAALVGGVIVWSRPWRWGLKPALFAGLLPQLLRTALDRPIAAPDAAAMRRR